MLFVQPSFLFIFLPLLMLGLYIARKTKRFDLLIPLILLGSMVFYGVWSIKYLFMLIAMVLVNYHLARYISKQHQGSWRKWSLIFGLSFHLLALGYFKYTGFLAEVLSMTVPFNIILPLAISFYTFQQISYLVDIYKEEQPPAQLLEYFTYIFFFPQLIAGPIVQYPQVSQQLKDLGITGGRAQYRLGFAYLVIGLLKKWMIADPLAPLADNAFLYAQLDGQIEPLFAWLGLLAYTFQLYFDFSAYGDMAIGLGLLVGISLPINFNSPYKAETISDFWRRWHITLGAFLRQYLFIPLGGSRGSSLLTMRNLFIVMLLGGIWHGAGWGFLIWGVLHGSALIVHYIYKQFGPDDAKYRKVTAPIYMLLTFAFVCLAWVPFKAETIDGTIAMYHSLFTVSELSALVQFTELKSVYGLKLIMTQSLLLVCLPLLVWGCHNSHVYAKRMENYLTYCHEKLKDKPWFQVPAGIATGISISLGVKWMAGMPVESFLYFQF